jgi:hypothetical protein
MMTGRRIAGIVLVIVGVVILLWGGVFWTDRDTIVDVGELEVTTESREGVAVPPILGGVALVAGILLLVLPQRRRV